jgi:flagella basal body P-ring formation protein FlgA
MIAAMHEALPEARVELIDSSRVPAPDGVLEFPPSGLRAGYWYGYVTYGAGRRFSVWARVRVSVPLKQFIASADLKAGQSIEASSVTQAVMWTVLAGAFTTLPTPLESATGYVPRRTIPAGTAIRREWLEPPKLIQRGDMVKVEVVSRSAKIELTARAEASGALGEFILIENPDSKRRFRARVEAAGRVSVKGSL